MQVKSLYFLYHTGVQILYNCISFTCGALARALFGEGGGREGVYIDIFVFCPIDFF